MPGYLTCVKCGKSTSQDLLMVVAIQNGELHGICIECLAKKVKS